MAVGTTAVTSKATGTSVHPFICQHLNYNILINYLAFYCTKYVLWFYSRVLEDGAWDVQNMGGGVIYVVGLIISNGIVQKVDVTSTYSICCGGKRKVTESKRKCDRSSKQVKLYHLQLHVFITFDTF